MRKKEEETPSRKGKANGSEPNENRMQIRKIDVVRKDQHSQKSDKGQRHFVIRQK